MSAWLLHVLIHRWDHNILLRRSGTPLFTGHLPTVVHWADVFTKDILTQVLNPPEKVHRE
ncbi:hypothetical protein EYF80_038713 [Liparis tanakae]|uniref:Uncharacterized protein n=1 Tax=Liparis tanakae TaxID=230148 RepID=A0A4Z2GBY9_9TELE|nr:hypothetical protein EYF80_038713 [Liparis tanakae]